CGTCCEARSLVSDRCAGPITRWEHPCSFVTARPKYLDRQDWVCHNNARQYSAPETNLKIPE
ncbi:MAG: hypothetical protein VXZ53_15475, partial [Planctomycetota bacterium]|nr:hypothetical protein [Planctomycetota bacterium]